MLFAVPLCFAPSSWCLGWRTRAWSWSSDEFVGHRRRCDPATALTPQHPQRQRTCVGRRGRLNVALKEGQNGQVQHASSRRKPGRRETGVNAGTLVLTRPVFLSRRPNHHQTFERPLARWMHANLITEDAASKRYTMPDITAALRHITNALQEPLQYADFITIEHARQHIEELSRGGPQNLPAFEFLAPIEDEQQQPFRGLRGRGTFGRQTSRATSAVAPQHRFHELRVRPAGAIPESHTTGMRKASVGNEVLSRSLEQQTAMCEGNFQRSDTEPRRALSVLPGSIDWAEEGAMEKWYARASRWRLLDGGTLCYTQRSVIELSRSQATTSAPAAGNPIVGFRALGASWTRFLCNHPRIIAIGDVHGCITELQDLLRVCDYRPGDEVILLGDLVAKGPDSQAVVQMAREIGAKAVRGNHDHEVIRCREAMLRGHDPSYASIDHMRIARQLSQLEHEWMRTWPWYIQSEDLETIFVHAGFLPSAPLDQQLPRHMMNIRSVMENGTPSARHATGMSWARLWTGPLRVVFGHDAFMGLQIWDKCIGIDTGCVYGGRLTALLLPENRLVSVPARKMYVLPRKRSQ